MNSGPRPRREQPLSHMARCGHPRSMKMRLDSEVPPGLGLILSGYPRVPLCSTLGCYPAFPTGTTRAVPACGHAPVIAEFSGQILPWVHDDSAEASDMVEAGWVPIRILHSTLSAGYMAKSM